MSGPPNNPAPTLSRASEPASRFGLEHHGLSNLGPVHWNPSAADLVEAVIARREGRPGQFGALLVDTGERKQICPEDHFIVREPATDQRIWWGERHRPIGWATFNLLLARVQAYLQGREVFVQDCYLGGEIPTGIPLRIVTELAWHSLFVRNAYFKPTEAEILGHHIPDFTLLVAPLFRADPRRDGTRSEAFVAINLAERLGIVGGTAHAGEIRHAIFTAASYFLLEQDILPLRCLVNLAQDGETAIFVGSPDSAREVAASDPTRTLVGDDQHGWDDNGIMSLLSGSYLAVGIHHSPDRTILDRSLSRVGAILENAAVNLDGEASEIDTAALTSMTRASIPANTVEPKVSPCRAGHPRHLFLVTSDMSGVLPPIARLSAPQAAYYYLSGYISQTIDPAAPQHQEPPALFRPGFGVPVLAHHPYVLARMLQIRMTCHHVSCWLLNTGWTGGPWPQGQRIPPEYGRALVGVALSGSLAGMEFDPDPVFQFDLPRSCPGVPGELLHPDRAWSNKDLYIQRRDGLAARFIEHFRLLEDGCPAEVSQAGPIRQPV